STRESPLLSNIMWRLFGISFLATPWMGFILIISAILKAKEAEMYGATIPSLWPDSIGFTAGRENQLRMIQRGAISVAGRSFTWCDVPTWKLPLSDLTSKSRLRPLPGATFAMTSHGLMPMRGFSRIGQPCLKQVCWTWPFL